MKILSIAGRNLNSLRLDFKVDFSAGVLKDCGIFAITGPTGAGKTTLLDAITLALYGRTPRSATDEDIISYGAGEAWAEVVFQTSEGCFKSEWKVRRARSKHDGTLQQSTMEVSSYPDGRILTQRKREAQDKIKDLIKLEYDQFLKSVLLAQGAFKAFLDAKEGERGEMLEKISDTSLYTKLSKKAFERKRKEEQALAMLKAAIGNVVLLSDEERATFINKTIELKNEEQHHQAELRQFQVQLNWLQTITDLIQKQEGAAREVENARSRLENEQANMQRWEVHQQVAGLESKWSQYQTKKEESVLQRKNIDRYQYALEILAKNTGEVEKASAVAFDKAEMAGKLREEKMPAILEAITRKADMLTEKKQLNLILEKRKVKISEESACNSRILSSQTVLLNNKKTLNDLGVWLRRYQTYIEASGSCTQASLIVSELKRSRDDIEICQSTVSKTNEQMALAKNQVLKAELNKQEAVKEQEVIRQLRAETSEKLSRLRSQLLVYAELNHQHLEKATRLLEEQQNQHSRKEFLAEHLSLLHEGESCPLCGSTEHPNQTLSIIDVQSDIATIKDKVKKYQTFIKTRGQQQKTVEKLLANLDEYIDPVDIHSQLPQNFEALFNEWIQAQKSLPKLETEVALKLASVYQLREKLADNIAQLESEKSKAIEKLTSFQVAADKQIADLREIASEYELPFDPGIPSKLPEALKKCGEEYLRKSKEESVLKGTIPEIEAGIETLTSQLESFRRDIVQLLEDIEVKNQIIQQYSKEISAAHQGYASPETARDKLNAEEKTANERVRYLTEQLNALRQETGKTQGEKINAELHFKDLEISIHSLLTELNTGLREMGLDEDIELIGKRLLKGNERLTLEKLYKSLHDKLLLSIAHYDTCKSQLEQQQSLALTVENIDAITEKINQIQRISKELNREFGRIEQVLKADDDKQLQIKEVKKEIEAQETILEKWAALSNLIGSADGKKFNQFAQGLTLDRLILISNHHLQFLNDRYRLKRNLSDQGLRLLIIDQYQADNEREINTLSGGESFLVSLALALGLSEMTSKLTTIDSLFIDEGFGTLDADTLEVALNALRELQIGGKTIGIISHVERLKEEIYTQVEITKGADGFSTLRVIPEL